jgi:hypothetical protein
LRKMEWVRGGMIFQVPKCEGPGAPDGDGEWGMRELGI